MDHRRVAAVLLLAIAMFFRLGWSQAAHVRRQAPGYGYPQQPGYPLTRT